MDRLSLIPLVDGFAVVLVYHYRGTRVKSQASIEVTFVKMDKLPCSKEVTLNDLLKEHGYTQKSFAIALNKAYSTVRYYISKEKMPTVTVIADMCRLLDESPKTVMKSLGIDVTGIPDDRPNDH